MPAAKPAFAARDLSAFQAPYAPPDEAIAAAASAVSAAWKIYCTSMRSPPRSAWR